MTMAYRLLVLDDDEHALDGMVELLREAGYHVTPAIAYDRAKRLLVETTFDMLITDVRLRSFNGLHLIMHCRREYPDMALMITTGYDEPLMELEASRYNAAFVRKPLKTAEFLEAVAGCLSGVRRQRRWPRKRVVGGFRVTAAGRPAAVVDVSYGGLRLEMPHVDSLPATFGVEVAGIGLRLEVAPVWSYAADSGALVCGAALASESNAAAQTWRAIVDRLTA